MYTNTFQYQDGGMCFNLFGLKIGGIRTTKFLNKYFVIRHWPLNPTVIAAFWLLKKHVQKIAAQALK